MTLLKKLVGFLALATLFISCQKEMSLENNQPIVIDSSDWQFTESGKTYMGSIDTGFITEQTGFKIITLMGTSADGLAGQIIFQIADDDLAVGTYTDDDQAYFVYAENQQILYESVPGPGDTDFSITITAIDSFSIEGTFSGTVKGADGSFKLISDGKFKGVISYAAVIRIAPNPDNDDYFQMGTKWVYRNSDDENDVLTITNIGDTTIIAPSGTFAYAIFENSRTGEHRYYRKDGNHFYEYAIPRLGSNASSDALDILILKQDGEVGDTWETDPYKISAGGGGLSVDAKLRYSISNKGFSSLINGITYENLTQVDTDLYVKVPGGDYDLQAGYGTIYSKGIGVVAFYDFTLDATYILTSYTP